MDNVVALDALVVFLVATDVTEEGEEMGGGDTEVRTNEDVLVCEVTLLSVIDGARFECEVDWERGVESECVLETRFELKATRLERRLFHYFY